MKHRSRDVVKIASDSVTSGLTSALRVSTYAMCNESYNRFGTLGPLASRAIN